MISTPTTEIVQQLMLNAFPSVGGIPKVAHL